MPPLRSNPKPELVAVIPTDRELQIDLDSRAAVKTFRRRLNFIRARNRAYKKLRWHLRSRITRSKSKKWHATVTSSQRMTLLERLCLQTLLGDDPQRAIYNFYRYLNESRFPILFYEKGKHHGA